MNWIKNGKEAFAEYKQPGQGFGMYPLGAKMVTKENYRATMGKAEDESFRPARAHGREP
jgi:hypothetical protein